MIYQFKTEHYVPKFKIKVESNVSYTRGKSSAPDFKNYNYFLSILITVTLLCLESLSLSIALLVETFAYKQQFLNRISVSYNSRSFNYTLILHGTGRKVE
jgi:hypothetical protein